MVRTNHVHEGSALLLCIVLMFAMTAVFTQVHQRFSLFARTVYERERYLKVRAATHALMSCALDKACKSLPTYIARRQYQTQFNLPIDNTNKAQASITYQQRDTPEGAALAVNVKVTYEQRTCMMHAVVRAVYDPYTHTIKEYIVKDWCIS